jgi:three-Cys-motif partner protein
MGKLVPGSDGLPAEEVGQWVEEKHFFITEYIKLSHGARRKFVGPQDAGAAYIDLFCGPGQGRIKDTKQYIDGAAVAAWKTSKACGSPFTTMFLADRDEVRRDHCAVRLRKLGAPVAEIEGTAEEAVQAIVEKLPSQGLHFAFLDPYSLGSLSFELLRSLAKFHRMDILVLISAMDLFRNIDQQSTDEAWEFDEFAPAWREHVPIDLPQTERRETLMRYWAWRVQMELGLNSSSDMHPVMNSVNRLIYWLLLLHRHKLAEKFWKIILKGRPQRTQEMRFDDRD